MSNPSATPAVTATLSVEEARVQLAVQVGEMNKCKNQMGALQQVCSACVRVCVCMFIMVLGMFLFIYGVV
jgi:hypothetical protein